VLSIPLLYALVKRQFGQWAGLIAALALAVVPVTVATERNNTIDGLLVFILLLATWAFWRATRSGRLRDLLLGAILVGLGFNIKMLQAFIPLPAFYALYLLGAPQRWWKRVVHLSVATVVLVAISLSWAIAVDLTPAEERPFIGSSSNNSVLELIVGHNGLRRLGLDDLLASDGGAPSGNDAPGPQPPPTGQRPGHPPPPPGGSQMGQPPGNRPVPPPTQGSGADNGPAQPPPPSQPGGRNRPGPQPRGPSQEVGAAGWSRLFSEPLVTEASWVLPLALLGIPLLLVVLGPGWPLSDKQLALVLWCGWLLPALAYFSFNSGLFHAYYLIMLGPPLAALVGATAWALWRVCRRRHWLGWASLALFTGVTVAFQVLTLRGYPDYATWIGGIAVALLISGLGILALARRARPWVGKIALGTALAATLVAPLVWSGLTTFNTHPNAPLPHSGPDTGQPTRTSTTLSPQREAILDYLLANSAPDSYLVATLSSHGASPYILATGRPVLTFGGFNGNDDVIDAAQLAQMVTDGELRFVLDDQDLTRRKAEIGAWVTDHCTVVTIPGATASPVAAGQTFSPRGPVQDVVLYDCGSRTSRTSWQLVLHSAPFKCAYWPKR
jgi:4-amino-4-deoxy-L-arabinose transferase-like glycosyltransferase